MARVKNEYKEKDVQVSSQDHDDLIRAFGRMEAQLDAQGRELHALKKDVREVRDALVRVRGGRMLLAGMLAAGAIAGSLMTGLIKLGAFWKG